MAKLIKIYLATMQEAKISFIMKEGENLVFNCKDQIGILEVYESERRCPGVPFVVFYPWEGKRALQTSPGKIIMLYKQLYLGTHDGRNQYLFEIITEFKRYEEE